MHEWVLLSILFLFSAFFSASETALTSLSKIKLNRLIEQRHPAAGIIKKLKDNPSLLLSMILTGNNLVNIAASALATSMAIRQVESSGSGSIGLAVGLVTGIMTFLVLVFGEVIPKTVALRNTEKFSLFLAPLLMLFKPVLMPIAYLIGFISRPFIVLFGGIAPEKGPLVTEDEIHMILAAGEKEGVIEQEEREMISSIFEFGDTVAREVMTPRPDIDAVEAGKGLEEIKKLIMDSGHSRIPVYEGSLDNVVGMLYAKDLLGCRNNNIKDYLRPVIFVPEAKKIDELLHEMQAARTHFAVIVDEYGMTSGVVTLEDIIEEIVGEIHDEFEREEKRIVKVNDHSWLVDGSVLVADLNDELKINLPEKEYDTIGGLVFGQMGKVPAVGNTIDVNNVKISVERVHRRRVTRVKVGI